MEKGLYKNDNGTLLFAEISVSYPDGMTLTAADYQGQQGEIHDGWYWFDSRRAALDHFGITEETE